MAGKRCRIEGLPKAKNGMHVMDSDPRSQANVEAEIGETMVTRDNISNQRQLVSIGGKKHSKGGTPLNAPEGSAIYSDTLKIKNPVVLKFFNESGKKPKTFAQISKKYNISKLQEERENENNDKITNASLDKSIDDANFKLSALFTVQEFHEKKGAPEEHSKHFEAFLDRMGLDYEQIFGTQNQSNADQMGTALPMGKYGYETVEFSPLPKAKAGDVVQAPPYNESQSYTRTGIERLNKYLKIYGIEELDLDAPRSAVKAKISEAQRAAVNANPDLIFDFMTTDTGDDVEKSHRPNNKLQNIMKGIQGTKVTPSGTDGTYTNDDLRAMLEEGTLTTENVADAYQDNKWWYRMVNSDIKTISEEEMAEKRKLLDEKGIQQGDFKYLYMGDGYYEAYRTNPDGTIEQVEPDPAVVDELYKWDVEHLDASPERERNMDFLWANKRALRQARKAKRNIPFIKPFTPTPQTEFVDQAYYSPDQAIAAIQSLVDQQGTKQAMFAPQQQQTANFLASQQFELMGKVIGQYEDKNVQAYNREQMLNTQIANRASDRLSRAIEGHHDKWSTLKQNYANAMNAADANIAENEIAMWQERADRLNLEATIGEQFAKDPTTGIHEFQVGKDFAPTSGNQTTVADRFNELKNQMPGVDDSVVAKMAMAMHSGKYDVQFDTHPQNAQQYQ